MNEPRFCATRALRLRSLTRRQFAIRVASVALTSFAAIAFRSGANAQVVDTPTLSTTLTGYLQGFTVTNNTGQPVNDFEVILGGVAPGDIYQNLGINAWPAPYSNLGFIPHFLPLWLKGSVYSGPLAGQTTVHWGYTPPNSPLPAGFVQPGVTGFFGITLNKHLFVTLECMRWTLNGVPVYAGPNPNLPVVISARPASTPDDWVFEAQNYPCSDGPYIPRNVWIQRYAGTIDRAIEVQELEDGSPLLTATTLIDPSPILLQVDQKVENILSVPLGIEHGAPSAAMVWYVAYEDNNGAPGALIGSSYFGFNFLTVPEPASAALFAGGNLVLAGLRRRSVGHGR